MMAGNEAECYSTQLIDGDGTFNGDGLDRFIKQVKLVECGLSYAVVAIMGPQSSGKSTLINHLFGTNFKEMDTDARRSQTTKGIWIARCVGIEPCTIVMDLEGTDGRERGEDDTAFEKQSTLFAIVVSDIVLINIWCHDIGREHAANKPLLRTVFRVMLQLFSSFKKTLMFVIRDKTRTLLKHLEDDLRGDVEKIWDSVPKPKAHKHTRLRDLFNVEVVALSNYEENEEQFKEQVVKLRQKFFQSIAPGGLAGDRREVVPASGFSLSAQRIWKRIKENKDLDLPAHRVMVATLRCDAIVTEKYSTFFANKDWLDLQKAVETHPVEDFGKKLSSMISNCLSSYDREATYFEASVTSAKRKQLEGKLLQLVQPAYQLTLKHIRDLLLEKFKKEFSVSLNGGQGFAVVACDYTKKFMRLFDEQCERAVVKQANWNLDKIRDKFSRNLNSHITEVRIVELSKLTTMHESNLNEALYLPVKGHLEIGCDRTWPAIRELLQRETQTAVSEFSSTLLTFDMDKQNKEDMISKLKNHARGLVEQTAREEAGNALHHMKERFTSIFNYDDDHMPRAWAGERNIPNIAKIARTASLKLLSVLAAIRLDDTADTIWNTLVQTLLERTEDVTTSHDLLSSRTWKEVSATETLIAPSHCNSLWSQFQKETQYAIDQATNELLAAKKRKKELLLLAMNVALIAAPFQHARVNPATRFLIEYNEMVLSLPFKPTRKTTRKKKGGGKEEHSSPRESKGEIFSTLRGSS